MTIISFYWNIVNKKVAWNWSKCANKRIKLLLWRQFEMGTREIQLDRSCRGETHTLRMPSITNTGRNESFTPCSHSINLLKQRCHNVCWVVSIFLFWKCELKYDTEKIRMNSLKKMISIFIKGKVIVFNVTDSTESDYISNFLNPMILIQNIIIPRNYES